MKILLSILLIIGTTASAFGWGAEGHQAVAEVARGLLTDSTRAQVVKLLGNDDLATVATWADEVRAAARHQGPLSHDLEASNFNKTFPGNEAWHFINLPLGTTSYTDDGPFSTTNDVVHAINNSVATLEGAQTGITKLQALRLVVHFVGDIHQPLHVGTGYYEIPDPSKPVLVTDPTQVGSDPNDVGGNDLYWSSSSELHAYWDTTLVVNVAKSTNYTVLATALTNDVNAEAAAWKDSGDYHQWAEAWAGDSVKQALPAFTAIKNFGPAQLDSHDHLVKITIPKPTSIYLQANTTVVKTQLEKAGYRLAELLNSIKWTAP